MLDGRIKFEERITLISDFYALVPKKHACIITLIVCQKRRIPKFHPDPIMKV